MGLATGPAMAGVTVNGYLDDWGISYNGNGTVNYSGINGSAQPNPAAGYGGVVGGATVNGFSYQYHIEDQNDWAGRNGQLGPNQGGQEYDAEFLGAGVDGTNFVIAILTGQRPDNGFSDFSPGDVRIQTSAGLFGVEVGGGKGSKYRTSGEITEGNAGTTYEIVQNNGSTEGYDNHGTGQVAGSIWKNATWSSDPIASPDPDIQPQLTGGELLDGLADLSFLWKKDSKHAVIEIAFSLDFFGGANILGVEWAPGCGNDIVSVYFPTGGIPSNSNPTVP